ncbi:MAG: hypothetical protein HY911_09200 [Desulfobacterales bacterium]|nr:hypothetical protein [Desulfobacterales bacterium]
MGTQPPTTPVYESQVLTRAEIDECYSTPGQSFVPGPNCGIGQRPKANQSYLWGLAKSGDNLWIGTGSNMLCVMYAYAAYNQGMTEKEATQNDMWACEYSAGRYIEEQLGIPAPALFNDFRPPKIYTYNLGTKTLTDQTGQITNPLAVGLLKSTFGLRSAAAFGNVVFLGGPLALGKGINLCAFNATTGAFIGARNLAAYQNVRRWLVYNGALYAAVANEAGGGRVLRWTGSDTAPFAFEEVGAMDAGAVEIAAHNGRLYVGTWPDRNADNPPPAGLWMSPAVPAGGLTAANLNSWQKVWNVGNYEPDPVIRGLYGMGAMASYGGYLYWGTMHSPAAAFGALVKRYNISSLGIAPAFFNGWRAAAIFRAADPGATAKVELLYGDANLPVFVSPALGGIWTYRPNNMSGAAGKYGTSGFGNLYNNYTWTMAVYKDQLYVGTMDNSYLWLDWDNLFFGWLEDQYFSIPPLWTPDEEEYGADLWRFPSASQAAVRMTRNGYDNYFNYGFRTILADDATGLYLGTANPANIARDTDGTLLGGWELIRLIQR